MPLPKEPIITNSFFEYLSERYPTIKELNKPPIVSNEYINPNCVPETFNT